MTKTKIHSGIFVAMAVAVAAFFLQTVEATPPPPTRYSDEHQAPARIKAGQYDVAPPGANTDILASRISPTVDGSVFRIAVAVTTASVVNVSAYHATATQHTWGLNGSAALNAGDLYSFSFPTDLDLTYNFQVETDGTIEFLSVQEVVGETY